MDSLRAGAWDLVPKEPPPFIHSPSPWILWGQGYRHTTAPCCCPFIAWGLGCSVDLHQRYGAFVSQSSEFGVTESHFSAACSRLSTSHSCGSFRDLGTRQPCSPYGFCQGHRGTGPTGAWQPCFSHGSCLGNPHLSTPRPPGPWGQHHKGLAAFRALLIELLSGAHSPH